MQSINIFAQKMVNYSVATTYGWRSLSRYTNTIEAKFFSCYFLPCFLVFPGFFCFEYEAMGLCWAKRYLKSTTQIFQTFSCENIPRRNLGILIMLCIVVDDITSCLQHLTVLYLLMLVQDSLAHVLEDKWPHGPECHRRSKITAWQGFLYFF